MNKKGLTQFVTIMLAVTIVVLALALGGSVREFTDDARAENSTIGGQGLDCDNETLSDYTTGTCIIADLYIPTFIGVLMGLAGAVIGARIIFAR